MPTSRCDGHPYAAGGFVVFDMLAVAQSLHDARKLAGQVRGNQHCHGAPDHLFCFVPEESFGARIPTHYSSIHGFADNGIVGSLDHGGQVRSPFVGLFALGDVTNEAGDQGLPARLQVAETDVNGKLRTIFAPAVQLQPCTRWAAHRVPEVGGAIFRMPAPGAPGQQHFHLLSQQLFARVAEQPLGLGIDQNDPAILPGYHNGIRRAFED